MGNSVDTYDEWINNTKQMFPHINNWICLHIDIIENKITISSFLLLFCFVFRNILKEIVSQVLESLLIVSIHIRKEKTIDIKSNSNSSIIL